MRRTLLPALALAGAALLASAPSAFADDVITPGPSSQPGDPFGGQTVPPGPVIVVTPGSPGSQLPGTSDPEDVQEQIDRDIAANGGTPTSGATGSPGAAPSSTASPTAGVQAPEDGPASSSNDSADSGSSWSVWWLLGTVAAALAALAGVLLIARRRRDRAPADSLE